MVIAKLGVIRGPKLNLIHSAAIVSALLCAGELLAQEDCLGLKYKSNERIACEGRNNARFEQRMRDEESQRIAKEANRLQERQLELQKEQLEVQKKQQKETREEAERDRWRREDERRGEAIRQQQSQLAREKQELAMQALAELIDMGTWLEQRPRLKNIGELQKSGKCKAARNLVQNESLGGDKTIQIYAEFMYGNIAKECEKNIDLAKLHWLKAALLGGHLAKVQLEGLSKAEGDYRGLQSKTAPEAPGHAVVNNCKVNDEDISSSYSGECKEGLAHGKGVAKGRDEYRGHFSEGNINGYGIYVWGASSEWAGERYEGEYVNGAKHGFGASSVEKNAKNGDLVGSFKKDGIPEGNRYVMRGIFENNAFIVPCKSAKACQSLLTEAEQDFEKGNQFVKSKEHSKAFPWIKRSAEKGNVRAQAMLGLMYLSGDLGVERNTAEGARWTLVAANRGRATAQSTLAYMYRERDPAESAKWFRKAAEQGLSVAQHALGQMYEKGQGVAKDEKEAASWYRKAADQGEAEAQFSLFELYLSGKGVTQDAAEAARWLRKSAENGLAKAQLYLARLSLKGAGVAKSESDAAFWFRKAADQGHAEAQHGLGLLYKDGTGVSKDGAEAVSWIRKAADQGNANAQVSLGIMYFDGNGVTKDMVEASRWWRKAADQGWAEAQYGLGLLYKDGAGVSKDAAEAVSWFRKAANQGHANGQVALGNMYLDGNGVTKDMVEASRWYRKAADQGWAEAQYGLGLLYKTGTGVSKDAAEAVSWFRKASDQGHPKAKIELEKLTAQKPQGSN